MKLNQIEKFIGSGFYTGYIPKASGTFASLLAMLLFLIPGFENPSILIFIISLSIVAGVKIANRFESVYGKDPSQFTFDEFIGTWITLLFIPKKIWYLVPAFILWRFLDIVKPFPAKKLELLKGGWGVVLDDVMAGIYSFIVIQITIHLINRFL
ncbi:MAG TPA: phosphatidylglycerophosphatase A [Melioribacteraceae bacterium]|nr:phosphatidylglycerophosphatase A [Melioribacteraceae bacterium]